MGDSAQPRGYDGPMDDRDATTSPRWLQTIQAAFLLGLVVYFVVVFQMSLTYVPKWAVPGLWQMFTLRDPTAAYVVAEARYKDRAGWESIELGELFPSRWGSGYRFSRSSFKKNPRRMRVLGASTCLRLPEEPTAVRFREIRWRKVMGTLDHDDETERPLYTHRCGTRVRLPGGRELPRDGRRP